MNLLNIGYLDNLRDLIFSFLQHQIFLAPIILLIIEEAGVPLPVENIIFAYTGYQIANGNLPFLVAYIMLLGAVLIGASILYHFSARYGQTVINKFGTKMHVNEEKLVTIKSWFKKYSIWFIIFGRHVPGFRVPITIFSGMSRITYRNFILCVLISDAFTLPFYLTLGMKLGPRTVHLLSTQKLLFSLVVTALVIIVTFFYLRKGWKKKE